MFSNRQFYPDEILLAASVTDQTLQEAMEYLISGEAQHGCKIMMNDNLITHPQLDVLLKALTDERCPTNIEIFLDYCHLTNAHAQKFADLFRSGRYPTNMRLHLHGNNIGDDGFLAMVHALSRDNERPGVFLNLQYNQQLSDASLHTLAHLITTDQITDGVGFDLDNNPLLSDGVALHVISSLAKNTAVVEFNHNICTFNADDDAMLDGDIGFIIYQRNLQQKDIVQFYCDRNRLLQKYKHNPDLQYHLHCLSEERGCKLPPTSQVPSLRFFAARTAFQNDYAAFAKTYPGGYESLIDLTKAMADCQEKLGTPSLFKGCPWPCNIL